MKIITLNSGKAINAVEVYGGKELYQGSRREYLEVVVSKKEQTVEGLDSLLSITECARLTITEPDSGEQYIHDDYVLSGGARMWQDEESGEWYVAVKRYQRTELERTVAQLQAAVAQLQGA